MGHGEGPKLFFPSESAARLLGPSANILQSMVFVKLCHAAAVFKYILETGAHSAMLRVMMQVAS
ncbi:MAG: hypothetical protein COX19_11855 [Desulfobacterales bacterium CG23_combo_of_CG06-09_8_20_14_all_51_8]|nr:MAG: hypothetical protein COX19_11855 [Desulfobacterales bacterium CG23_combo_of_CG06-09_8_20_14_all_51_8]